MAVEEPVMKRKERVEAREHRLVQNKEIRDKST